jgi:hypothetical protein
MMTRFSSLEGNLSMNRLFLRAVLATTVAILAGCSSSDDAGPGDDGPPNFNAADQSISCPAGQIGWNFTTGGANAEDEIGAVPLGIQIVSSYYGNSRGVSVDQDLLDQCQGRETCRYRLNYTAADPSPGKKYLNIKYRCGAEAPVYEASIPGEAGGQSVDFGCRPKLKVVSATWGPNRGVAKGTHTEQMTAVCENRRECSLPVNTATFGNAPQGSKDFNFEFRCGDSLKTRSQGIPGDTTNKTYPVLCELGSTVVVRKAAYGSNNRGETLALANACDGLETCDYTVVRRDFGGDPSYVNQPLSVEWSCGQHPQRYTASIPAESNGKKISLSCKGAGGNTLAQSEYKLARKECVPAACDYNQKRDENMKCVSDNTKVLLSNVKINTYVIKDAIATAYLNPNSPHYKDQP